MIDFWNMVDFWIFGDSWIMGDPWTISEFWIMGDFSIMGDGGQAHKQTDRETHHYRDSAWPKGWAEWKVWSP